MRTTQSQDNRGYNAIHHLVELEITAAGLRATYDNVEMLGLLSSAGVDAAVDGNGNKSALQMAEEAGAQNLAAKLSALLGRGGGKAGAGGGKRQPTFKVGMEYGF